MNKKDFNYRLTEFFLNNSRLTILSFIFLLLLGAISFLGLKTTGFPNPSVNTAIITTVYTGASSDVVAKDVTKVLEGAIKSVDGVETYTSVSRNSVSTIVVTIDSAFNVDTVQNKIATSMRAVSLPAGVEAPDITVPVISTADFIFSLAGSDREKLYENWERFKADLNEIPETSSVLPLVDLLQKVVVRLDVDAVARAGMTVDEVQRQIASIGEKLPVVTNVTIDGINQTLTTSVLGDDLESLKNLQLFAVNPTRGALPSSVALQDIADVAVEYVFKDDAASFTSVRVGDAYETLPALIVNVRTIKDSDKVAYAEKVIAKLNGYSNVGIMTTDTWELPVGKDVVFIENLSTNDSTKEQVQEVVGGLIGSPLPTGGPFAALGWFLGGMQLVFLAMLLFVSWRAAVVAALAIPLSLLFSTIYVYFQGESLNTLVLFSLVLVLGLVVDPALVILESIQRKIDSGFTKNQAGLLAVKDVGRGLFLATLTNIIVFMPFGVISGILGQIFSFIPMTIIPATVGSYIVPLIFLVWFGSMFLKPTKGKVADEGENLWGVAKLLVRANEKILHSNAFVRLIIVVLALAIPLLVTIGLVSGGHIKFVQFASSENAKYITLSGTFLPTVTPAKKQIIQRQALSTIIATEHVKQVFPQSTRFTFFIELVSALERPNTTSLEISHELERKLADELNPYFFDWQVGVQGNGPPPSNYKVSLAIKTDDLDVLELASKDVGRVLGFACKGGAGEIRIDFECAVENRVVLKADDGYTGKETNALEVILDRDVLFQHHLVAPAGSLSLWVNQQVRRLFNIADDKKVGTVKVDGSDVDVFLEKVSLDPYTRVDVESSKIYNTNGEVEVLRGVAQIVQTSPKDTIQGVKGQTLGVVQGRLRPADNDDRIAALVTQAVVDYYRADNHSRVLALGLAPESVEQYSEGSSAGFAKSFSELLLALILAVIFSYFALAVFFNSLGMPLVILFTIPLTFIGVFPALAAFTVGEFGFLEIIGLIILVGVVENVAIFLIDAAKQKISDDNWDEKRAISFAAGIRLRPVILTTVTAIASLAPLAFLSEFYRSISLVIIFGLITSGFTSLFTTPILFVFFRWLSRAFASLPWFHKVVFFFLMPVYIVVMWWRGVGSEIHEVGV